MNSSDIYVLGTFPGRLAHLMKAHGWKQQALASRLNVAQSAVSSWLSGKKKPQPRTAKALAEIFAVKQAWLIRGDGSAGTGGDAEHGNDFQPDEGDELQQLAEKFAALRADFDRCLVLLERLAKKAGE